MEGSLHEQCDGKGDTRRVVGRAAGREIIGPAQTVAAMIPASRPMTSKASCSSLV